MLLNQIHTPIKVELLIYLSKPVILIPPDWVLFWMFNPI
jgi:hypothetical protein